jgi:hypothetical protein
VRRVGELCEEIDLLAVRESPLVPQLHAKFLNHWEEGWCRDSDGVMEGEQRLFQGEAHWFHLFFAYILEGRERHRERERQRETERERER